MLRWVGHWRQTPQGIFLGVGEPFAADPQPFLSELFPVSVEREGRPVACEGTRQCGSGRAGPVSRQPGSRGLPSGAG
jgi:hypothetical protein